MKGQFHGRDIEIECAKQSDLYENAVVYGRHHSNYIIGCVKEVFDGGAMVLWHHSNPGVYDKRELQMLFIRTDS